MTAIVDYGVGNLFSLRSSFAAIGEEAAVTGDAETLARADRVVLPGVGAFGDAADKLRAAGLDDLLRDLAGTGKPLLGICLGMQLLFDSSSEYGEHPGLGLIPGHVVPISGAVPADCKIPHIGWNALRMTEKGKASPLFRHIREGEFVYFVHSYYAADCAESLLADTEYGAALTAAVGREKVLGCQFHPEKSGGAGLAILKGFCEIA